MGLRGHDCMTVGITLTSTICTQMTYLYMYTRSLVQASSRMQYSLMSIDRLAVDTVGGDKVQEVGV